MRGKKYIIIAAINAVMLLLFCILTVTISKLASSLDSQKAALRWSADDEPYTQTSLFLENADGFTMPNIYETRAEIVNELSNNAIKGNIINLPDGSVMEIGRLWADAYSGAAVMYTSTETVSSVETNVIFTGGDYFLFHPLILVSGSYYSDTDLMKDRVVIDEFLAWQLYGAADITGMRIKVNGEVFYIAGVVKQEQGNAVAEVYGDRPRLYMPYESALKINEFYRITCYEACLPNPVEGLGYGIFKDVTVKDEFRSITVENSARFSLKSLWGIISSYDKSSVKTNAVVLPYFENAARIIESRAALLLVIAALSLIFPILSSIYFIWLLFKLADTKIKKMLKKRTLRG